MLASLLVERVVLIKLAAAGIHPEPQACPVAGKRRLAHGLGEECPLLAITWATLWRTHFVHLRRLTEPGADQHALPIGTPVEEVRRPHRQILPGPVDHPTGNLGDVLRPERTDFPHHRRFRRSDGAGDRSQERHGKKGRAHGVVL